mgnify:CR=1 FL=1
MDAPIEHRSPVRLPVEIELRPTAEESPPGRPIRLVFVLTANVYCLWVSPRTAATIGRRLLAVAEAAGFGE